MGEGGGGEFYISSSHIQPSVTRHGCQTKPEKAKLFYFINVLVKIDMCLFRNLINLEFCVAHEVENRYVALLKRKGEGGRGEGGRTYYT